jgi:cysteine synthase A
LVEQEAQRITLERNAYRANQFNNPSTMIGGEQGIGGEVISQLGEQKIDVFVDFMGTGGSFVGVSRALKKAFPNVVCFGLEPKNAPYYSGSAKGSGKHDIQGGGYNYKLKFVEEYQDYIDGFITISSEEAKVGSRILAETECIFGGFSSGANVASALKLLQSDYVGKNILILMPDSGTKYLSTSLWDY